MLFLRFAKYSWQNRVYIKISKSYANMVPTFTTIFLFVSKRAGETSVKGRFCPDFVSVISRLSSDYLLSIFRLSSVFVPYLSARLVHDFKTWSYKGTFDGFFGNNIHSSSGII